MSFNIFLFSLLRVYRPSSISPGVYIFFSGSPEGGKLTLHPSLAVSSDLCPDKAISITITELHPGKIQMNNYAHEK